MENTFHIQWHITDFCNLRCRHCYQSEFKQTKELEFKDLKKIFDNLEVFAKKEKRRLVIDITGGEPLLYKDWYKLISFINERDVVKDLGIITNGFFLNKEIVLQLEKLKNIKIKISCEGVSKTSYEYFRGLNSYKHFIDSCALLKDSSLDTTLMFTLFSGSSILIEDLFSFIQEYDFNNLILERFIPWGIGISIREKIIPIKEWVTILQQLCLKCGLEEEDILELVPYRGFMVKNTDIGMELFGAPCIVGKDGIALMPDGTVYPCRRFPLKIGNLREEKLEDILATSDVTKKLNNKNYLKGKCKTCIIDSCFGCRALAYSVTGDFLAEDPLCLIK